MEKMARISTKNEKVSINNPRFKKTSQGKSINSRPKSRDQKRNWKKYRGQGK